MKIGFFADGYLPQKNGVATSVEEYADGLIARGHDVTIIAPRYPRYRDKNKKVIRLSSVNLKKDVGVRVAVYLPEKAFVQLLRYDFDIIHGHGDGPITMLGWIIAKNKNIPFILSHHTFWNRYTHYFPGGNIINPRVVEKFTQLFANSCSFIIAPSNLSMHELKNYGITKPIKVIHHGLDLSNYQNGETNFLRKKAKIPADHKIVLYVGRLGKEKSLDLLFYAFQYIHQQLPKTSFVIVGNGPEKKHLRALAKELGIQKDIYFVGEVDYKKVPSVFYSADVFLFSSKTETLGKVIIESMAAGLPVVTLNRKPFKEIITNKVDSLLVPFSAKQFAIAAIKILSDETLRQELSQNAKERAKVFSIEHSVKQVEDVYLKTIKESELKHKQGIGEIFTKVRNFLEVEFW